MKAVHVPTKQDFDTLMDAYEAKGWCWLEGEKPNDCNSWIIYKKETFVDLSDKFCFGSTSINTFNKEIITLNTALKELNMHKLSNLKAGDLIKKNDFYRQVLSDVQHLELGELATVLVSCLDRDKNHNDLKTADKYHTLFQLEHNNYEKVEESRKVTMKEVIEKFGEEVVVEKE